MVFPNARHRVVANETVSNEHCTQENFYSAATKKNLPCTIQKH